MATQGMATRQAMLNAYITQFGSAAQFALFSGTMPTNADTALSGNSILAACPFSSTSFGAATAATPSVITANTITIENAYASGTASFYRIFNQGASTAITSLVAGQVVMINVAGAGNWTSIGAPNNSVGTVFVCTGVGSGTGSPTGYIMGNASGNNFCIEQGANGSDMTMNTTTVTAGGSVTVTPVTRQW